MVSWVAFFRGINVGGHNKLPMRELAELLAGAGCSDIATYIQSGNVVFQSSESNPVSLGRTISGLVHEGFGFAPKVLLMTNDDLAVAVSGNPFKAAEQDHKTLHFFFLAETPADPNLDALRQLQSAEEEFALTDKVFYLHAPGGIGRSKLAAKVERHLGVTVTARNWRTVSRMFEMSGTG